jgi:hypothetical protein
MDIERTESSGTKMDTMFANFALSVLLMSIANVETNGLDLSVLVTTAGFILFAATALCLTGNLGRLRTTYALINVRSSASQLGLCEIYVNFRS